MKYVRKWECSVCDDAVIIDTCKGTQSCGCGTFNTVPEYIKTKDFTEKYEILCLS